MCAKDTLRLVLLTIALFATSAWSNELRPPSRGGMTKSLGMPPRYNWFTGVSFGADFGPETIMAFYGKLGTYKAWGNPAIGAYGALAEGYAGARDQRLDGGLRGSFVSPFLRFGAGVDYNFRDEQADFLLSYFIPGRRGGIFSRGTDIRFEYLPTREHAINFAVSVPLWQPNAGKTRQHRDYISYESKKPKPVVYAVQDSTLKEALDNLRFLSYWINRLTTPYLDQNAWGRDKALAKLIDDLNEIKAFLDSKHPLFPNGITSEALVQRFHEEMDRAFSIAIGGRPLPVGESTEDGRRLARRAREVLLEEVILPYDRSLGVRRVEDTTTGLAINARGEFVRWVIMDIDPDAAGNERWGAAGFAALELLDMIEANRKDSKERWGLSEVVWIPLQYALRPEQHDSQAELDALIERLIGMRFTSGNHVWYLRDEQFQYEFYRMVQEARDYHVLWIHDYRGVNGEGQPDEIGFAQTKGYLRAMIDRAREYDQTGKFPVYMIAIDEIYWQANQGRIWSALLQDPLKHELRLGKKDYKWMEEEIAALQHELRAAVAASKLLQASARQYGENWLENQIKVHINITNPADPTFRSKQVIPILGYPDAVIRDHRKISFYDVSEADPYRGRAIFTGMGIGEHYAGATWEDRAILAQGPALLDLKNDARELFLSQGFEEDEVPYPLQAFPKADNYEQIVEAHTRTLGGQQPRALQMHNQTGYGLKPIDVTKAALYTLMPPGSILKTPDSLWNSPIWGSMLLGSALRGAKVFVIAPSLAGAPSSGFPQMSRAQELLERLIIAREILGDPITARGGAFRVGIYDPDVGVGDAIGRIRAIRSTWEKHPFLQDLYKIDPAVFQAMDEEVADFEAKGFKTSYLVNKELQETPKLHLKAQFFVSKEAWDKLIERPEWAGLYKLLARQFLESRSKPSELPDVVRHFTEVREVSDELLKSYFAQLTPEERDKIIYYLGVGSHNMNYRSFMMDGEAMFLVSYFDALPAMMDFIGMTGLCKWPETREELNELLPPYGGLKRKIGRFVKTGV